MTSDEKTPLEQSWVLQRERAVAGLRLVFAILAVVVIQLNPTRAARFPLLSTYCLGTFLFYSLIVFYFAWKNRLGSFRLAVLTTALDLTWVAMINITTGGTRTPFFYYYSFPVITASLRWGLKGSLPVALAGVAVYLSMRLTLVAESLARPVAIDTMVIRSSYLLGLGSIFGYISQFERKQNQKLFALSSTAAEVAISGERRRIAFELHDSILQSLATLILRLENCRRHLLESQGELSEELKSAEELSRSTMRDIREFLAGKMVAPLSSGTLVEKLRDELRFLRDGLGLDVVLECTPENITLPQHMEREIYYVLREALINVTRHANATRASIHLRQDGNKLAGILSDNGVGFEQDAKTAKQGFGLLGMAERIKKVGGELCIESSPGAGTNISFVVPLTS